MPDISPILEDVRKRRARTGLVTADRYFREVEGCFGDGFCPVKVAGADSAEQWKTALKEAESKLTYSTRRTRVLPRSVKASEDERFLLTFDGIVTTPRRDRDKDVLETSGAKMDPRAPLLMHHMAMMPIGTRMRTMRRNAEQLVTRFGIADTPLGRDNIPLVKAGVLRISHGFSPIKWELMDDEEGWHFKEFEIFEVSLVSIPSNPDAVITAFSEKDFGTDLMRGWYDRLRTRSGKRRKSTVTVPADVTPPLDSRVTKEFDARNVARRREFNGEMKMSKSVTRSSVPAPQRTFEDIQREYFAELAKADTDTLREAHRLLSLILCHAEEQEQAKAWDEWLSQIT